MTDRSPPTLSEVVRPGWVSLVLLVAGVGGLAAWVLTFDLAWQDLAVTLDRPSWTALAVASLLVPYGVHTARYGLLIRRWTPVRWRFVFQMVMACNFLNHFVVAKVGDFAQPLWLRRRTGLTYWTGLQIGLVRFGHSVLGMGLLVCLTLAVQVGDLSLVEDPAARWAPFGVAVALCVVGIAMLPRLSQAAARWRQGQETAEGPTSGIRGTVGRVRNGLVDLLQACGHLSRRQHLLLASLAFVEVVLDGLPYVAFAYAGGFDIGLGPTLNAALTLNAIEYMPTPPAMLGVQSWVATASLTQVGVSATTLAAAVTLHRVSRTVLIAAVGAPALAGLARGRDG